MAPLGRLSSNHRQKLLARSALGLDGFLFWMIQSADSHFHVDDMVTTESMFGKTLMEVGLEDIPRILRSLRLQHILGSTFSSIVHKNSTDLGGVCLGRKVRNVRVQQQSPSCRCITLCFLFFLAAISGFGRIIRQDPFSPFFLLSVRRWYEKCSLKCVKVSRPVQHDHCTWLSFLR